MTTDHGLTTEYTEFTVNLDAAATAWGFSYTNTFLLRFSHYDNAPADGTLPPYAGLGLDEVRVTGRVRGDYDFGDAPAPYPSTLADDGARHGRSAGPFLGALCDYEGDALPSWNALGDDAEHAADEDGVVLAGALVPGDSVPVTVTATASCFLDVWVDFGQNGSWSDPGDQVFAAQPLNAGTNALSIAVPAGAVLGANAFARFRVSSAPVGMPTGAAADGEVEDYRFEIVPPAPVVSAEPSHTPGTENTVFWSAVTGADTYRAMLSPDPAFIGSPVTADWAPLAEHTFAGLDEGLFYYRAQAGASVPGHEETWGQSTAAAFEQGTRTGTEVDAAGAVTLAHASGRSFTVGGGVPFLRSTFTGAVRGNVFKAAAGAVLTRVEFLLERAAPTAVQIIVYEGGANATDPYTLVLTRDLGTLPVGLDYADSGPFNLPLTANLHYLVGVAAQGTVKTNRNPVALPPETEAFGTWVKVYYADTYPAPAAIPGTNPGTSLNGYCQRLAFRNTTDYASPGTCVSPVVAPDPLAAWNTLEYSAMVPGAASLTVDVLPASGTTPFPGFTGLVSGASLAGLPLEPVRLRASFATSNNTQTAALHSWGLRWRTEADRVVAGPWSGAVWSRQDQLPPAVAEVTLLDASPTRSATVSFGVRFTEPVEKVEGTAPFDDFAVSAGAPPGAAVTGVSGADDLYMVTVSTGGGVSGTVGLRVLASGGLHDALGREMAADYDAGPGYDVDFTPPTVAEITPLDGSPTNAPLVRWRVRFSEPMTDAPTEAPFAGFSVEGVTGAAVIAVVAEPDACVVTAATGPHDGDLLLRVLAAASPLRDRVGWPLDGDALSPGAYAVRHLDWAVQPPATVQAREGQALTLHAQATGGVGGTAHQWFFSPEGAKAFEEVPGAVFPAWLIGSVLSSQAGDYYCEARDAWETIQSTTTRLEVEDSLPAASAARLALCAAALAMAGARKARRGKAERP
ncbi:MAG: immunoglobulin domain-containing protein [Candidatus Hydrogenedentes bacterium]|nr:immunoglobulin domain-containing protein [Candidatus Hydrogenedentota bacterium]